MSDFFWPHDSHGIDQLGVKGVALSDLQKAEFETPAWFVIPPEVFYGSLSSEEYEAVMLAAEQSKRPKIDLDFQLSRALRSSLKKALRLLCPQHERVAVRASPLESEWAGDYTRGLLENFLFVTADDVPRAVQSVWQSAFSEEVIQSRLRKALPPLPKAPAVIIQKMLNPESSGTAYSADPDSGKRSVSLIRSVFGLSTSMISTADASDQFTVSREGEVLVSSIAEKSSAHVCDHQGENGIEQVKLPEEKIDASSLTDAQVSAVALMVRKAGKFFGKPQVVEWAIEEGKLFVLQAHPILELRDKLDPEAERSCWSGRMLREDYPGVLSPLTYSLAARIYKKRIQSICEWLQVPVAREKAVKAALGGLVGMIRGRFYVNLVELQRIAILLSSKANRRDVEVLLGIEIGLPDSLIEEVIQESTIKGMGGLLRPTLLSMHLGKIARKESHLVQDFSAALSQLSAGQTVPNEDLRAHELVERISSMLDGMDSLVSTPTLIDAQIRLHYAWLCAALKSCGCGEDEIDRLTKPLMSDLGTLFEDGFAGAVIKLAGYVPMNSNLANILQEGSLPVLDGAVSGHPELCQHVDDFIEKFGHRAAGELTLDCVDYRQDKLPLWRLLGRLATALRGRELKKAAMSRSIEAAQQRLQKLGAKHSGAVRRVEVSVDRLKQLFIHRETCRSARAEYHDRLRSVVRELGLRLEGLGALRHAADVHYLDLEEVIQFVRGGGVNSNIKVLASSRHREAQSMLMAAPPSLRFESRGVVSLGSQVRDVGFPDCGKDARKGQFVGGSSGITKGRVFIATNAAPEDFKPGAILVVRETDPGWMFVIASASAVVVENAEPTSYLSVMTREMGIPCVVAAEGVSKWLIHEELIELNGETGEITRLECQVY